MKRKIVLLIFLELIIVYHFIKFYIINVGSILPIVLYQIELIVVINACHLKKFKGSKFIRRSIYFLPYLFSLFIMPFVKANYNNMSIILWILVALLLGLILGAPKLYLSRYLFNSGVAQFLPSLSTKDFLFDLLSYLFTPFLQELFYKIILLNYLLLIYPNHIALLFLGIFFVAEHYFHFASTKIFNIFDYIIQFIFTIVSGYIYIKTQSLLLCILIHATYNLLMFAPTIYRFIVNKANLFNIKERKT